MNPVQVLLTNWESADNLGDYAIVLAQVALLEEHLGCSVGILGNQPGVLVPPELQEKHRADCPWIGPSRGSVMRWARCLVCCQLLLVHPGLCRLLPRQYGSLVRLLSEADIVMPKGGGYYIGDRSLRKFLFLLRSLYPILLARRLGVRRVLWGHSIGPIEGWAGTRLLKAALRGATISVRDDASLALCRRLGLAVTRAPDLALLTRSEGLREPGQRLRGSGDADLVRIGVTARRVSRDPGVQRLYLGAVVAAVMSIVSNAADHGTGVAVHLVPQVKGPTVFEDDRPVLQELAALLGVHDCSLRRPPRDIAAALDTYRSLDFLVATRMHSAVLAACAGTPFFAFGYVGAKTQGLVHDLGLPRWTTTDQVGCIPKAALRCYLARDSLRLLLADGLEEARARLYGLRLDGSYCPPLPATVAKPPDPGGRAQNHPSRAVGCVCG